MKYLLLTITVVLIISSRVEAWPDKFDTYDYVGQAATSAMIAVDWMQTHQVATYPNQWSETNPILGKHPSAGKVNSYFALCEVGHAAISVVLPKNIEMPDWVKEYIKINKLPIRNIWQFTWFGIEAGTVSSNYSAGIRLRF
jgi:hypothetical protein